MAQGTTLKSVVVVDFSLELLSTQRGLGELSACVVWFGSVRFDLVWFGLVWFGLVSFALSSSHWLSTGSPLLASSLAHLLSSIFY